MCPFREFGQLSISPLQLAELRWRLWRIFLGIRFYERVEGSRIEVTTRDEVHPDRLGRLDRNQLGEPGVANDPCSGRRQEFDASRN